MTGPATAHVQDHRSKPRRRGQELVDQIFKATLAELGETGYPALSMDGIARRARVSKASLYRRWAGKTELVLAAVKAEVPDTASLRDTGSLRGDLIDHYTQLVATLRGPSGQALRGIIGETLHDPAVALSFSARSRGRSTALMRTLTEQAVARGDLPARSCSQRRLETGYNLIRHEFLTNSHIPDGFVVELVDDVVLPLLHAP